MSILTKEERSLKPDLIALAEEGCGRPEYNCQGEDPICEWCEPCLADIAARALDTIDEMELALKAIDAVANDVMVAAGHVSPGTAFSRISEIVKGVSK